MPLGPAGVRPSGTAHAHPPGPGFPRHAPSVYTIDRVTVGGHGKCVTGATSGRGAPPLPVPWEQCCSTGSPTSFPTSTPGETEEWLDSFDDIVDAHGRTRARYLLMKLLERARTKQVDFPATVSTPYVNTIPADAEP